MKPSTITRHLITALVMVIAILWPTIAQAQSTTTIHGAGLQPLVEERGSTQTLNVYGPGGVIIAQVATDSPAGGTPTTQTRYLLHDHLGSTRVVLDSNNQVLGSFDYSPFGETTVSNGAAGNVADVAYRYTGQEVNGALGTYNYHARHYDAGVGRFLGVDPARYNASPYLYANDNPINFVDRTGQQPIVWFISTSLFRDKIHFRTFLGLFGLANDLNIPIRHSELESGNSSGDMPQTKFSLVIHTHQNQNGFSFWEDGLEGRSLPPEAFAEFVYERLREENLSPEAVESILLLTCKGGCERNGVSPAERFFQHLLERLPNLERVVASPYEIGIQAKNERVSFTFFSPVEGRPSRELGLTATYDPQQFFEQNIDETVLRANRESLHYFRQRNRGGWTREGRLLRFFRRPRLAQNFREPLIRTYTRSQVEQHVSPERPLLSDAALP